MGTTKTVLFLGTGNHDRSRVAEILFNSVTSKMGIGWTAVSRGLDAKQPTKKEGPMAAGSVKPTRPRIANAASAQRICGERIV